MIAQAQRQNRDWLTTFQDLARAFTIIYGRKIFLLQYPAQHVMMIDINQ